MSPNWKPGDHIKGRWELREVIDRGGMGLIWVVVDRKDGSWLAAKTYKDTTFNLSAHIAERFSREAANWIHLGLHPNVTPALYMDRINLKPFLFLPYVHGGDLSQQIGTLHLEKDLSRTLQFAIQICEGMMFIRSCGIQVHRDLKPQNCLIRSDGTLMITDFGLSKVFDELETERPLGAWHIVGASARDEWPGYVTRTGVAVGTPAYMAPEQFLDAKHVTVRSDIYSFGVILFEMVTGKRPFTAGTFEELARLHMTAPPPRPECDGRLAALIEVCLAKKPEERLRDFESIRQRLEQIAPARSHQAVSRWGSHQLEPVMQLTRQAVSLSVLGQPLEALYFCEKALGIDPEDPGALTEKGKSLMALGRTKEALECLNRSAKLDPDDKDVWRIKGGLLLILDRYKEAVNALDRALKLDRLNVDVWSLKGESLLGLKRYEESLTCYERAIALDDRDELALLGKSVALKALGRVIDALISVDRLLELNPFHGGAADLRINLLTLVSTDRQEGMVQRWPSHTATPLPDPAEKVVRKLMEEAAAFYWFNFPIISKAGFPHYGRFVYERLLPFLAPGKQNDPRAWFILFDGDCLADPTSRTWYFRRQDRILLENVKQAGEGLCYLIGVWGQGTVPPEHIDRQLRGNSVLGYMGITMPDLYNREKFLDFQRSMSLVTAVRIDGRRFKRISYQFHSDHELRAMGFEPYSELGSNR